MTPRRFPPPWSVEEGETYFVVKDNVGQKLAYVDISMILARPLSHSPAMRREGSR